MKKGKAVIAHVHRGCRQMKGLLFVKESLRKENKRKFKYEIEFGQKSEKDNRLFDPNSVVESESEDDFVPTDESMVSEPSTESFGQDFVENPLSIEKNETSKKMGNQELLKLESTFALAILIWRFW